ncbi:MAG TPA: sulfatase [Candidatus Limnocylindrales bacterium]
MKVLRITAAVAVTALVLSGGSAAIAQAARPNVVVFMTDDQNVSSLPVMSNVRALLAQQGVTFANNFVSYPLCCPSRATYLTGQYPHNHDVMWNSAPDGGYYKLRGEETLPVWMRRAGYQTAHIGKYLNGYGTQDPLEIPPGWGEWYGSIDPTTYRMWGYTLNENGVLRTYGQDNVEDPALYQTDVYRAKAVDYINRKAPGEAPFFLSVATLAPHTEVGWASQNGNRNPRPAPRHRGAFADRALPKPPSFDEADVSDKPAHIRSLPRIDAAAEAQITRTFRSRLESLLAVDEAVAAIVNALQANGELANTVFIFTSDNGWLQGEYRIRSGKIHPYEESIRVPLIVRGPGLAPNTQRAAQVSNIDLAPTVLDAGDATAGIVVDGQSLLPVSTAVRPLLIETGPRPDGSRWYAAVRTPRFLYVEHSTSERELYDLQLDPNQLRSRHNDAAYFEIRATLAAELHRLMSS